MQYRSDISGLRAIAVVSVVLYHAELYVFGHRIMPAGFFGVDVFFVLSGYLISYLILEKVEEGNFSFPDFYYRRARRILPALFVMLASCVPVAWFLLHPEAMITFASSLLASIASVSNFLFWLEDSYTADASQLKPLLHTWSLAIEEQFYIILPPLLLLVYRISNNKIVVKWILIGLIVVSLSFAQVTSRNAEELGFFLLPSRAWELLCGTLLALSHIRNGLPDPSMRGKIWTYVGFIAVLVPMFIYSDQTPHPSTFTLSSVIGSVLLLRYGQNRSIVHSLLTWRPVVYIGLISYSLYLWHWPILVFARHAVLDVSQFLALALLLLALVCAALSYRFVETPFRTQRLSVAALYSFLTAGAIALAAVATWVIVDHGVISRFKDRPLLHATFLDNQRTKLGETYDPACYFHFENDGDLTSHPFEDCLVLDESRPNIVVLGDSMVPLSTVWGLQSAIDPANANIVFTAMAGCRPVFDYGRNENCRTRNAKVFEFVASNDVDLLVLAGGWKSTKIIEGNLSQTLEYLNEIEQNTLVIGSSLNFVRRMPVVHEALMSARGEIQYVPFISQAHFEADVVVSKIAAENDFPFISLRNEICPTRFVEDCEFVYDNVLLSFDAGHLTPTAAKHLFSQFEFDSETAQMRRR